MAGNRVISAVLTLKDKFTSSLKQPISATDDLNRKVKHSGNQIKRFGKDATGSFKRVALGAAGMVAGFAAINGVKGFVSDSISGFREFEQGMQNVKATTGLTGKEGEKDFQRLTDKAREMGRSTSMTSAEAAEGLNYLALAGWSTDQMLAGIHPTLQLAEAGALDLGRASDLVTDSMAAAGVGVEELEGYLDSVAQTSRKSNTDIDTLMDAIIIAGGTFDRLNVPLAESNAMLGVLANRGTKGAEAGTAINAIMDRMTDTTGPAGKAMKELGISAFDADGNFRGMETVLKEVEQAMSGMTDEQKAMYTSQIAGLNHSKSFQKIIAGLGDEYNELKADIEGADGALQEMGDAQLDSFEGAMKQMGSAIDDVMLTIGSALVPVLRSAAEYITENMPQIQQAVETALETAKTKMEEMKTAWEEGTGVIGALKGALELLNSGINWIVENSDLVIAAVAGVVGAFAAFRILSAISTVLGIFNTLMMALRAGTVMATFAQLGLNTAMLANPMTWVAIAIGVLIAAGIALYQNWDVVKEKAQQLWDKTKEVGAGIKTAFTEAFNGVKSAAATALNYVIEKINSVIGLINKIPGVNAPIIPKVDTSQVSGAAEGSYAVGTDRVPRDMLAQIHKDEMIIPASQSRVLRSQGIGINNIAEVGSLGNVSVSAVKESAPIEKKVVNQGNVTTNQYMPLDIPPVQTTQVVQQQSVVREGGTVREIQRNQSTDIVAILTLVLERLGDWNIKMDDLIAIIRTMNGGGDVNVNVDARDKTVHEIVNELVPMLQLRMANM